MRLDLKLCGAGELDVVDSPDVQLDLNDLFGALLQTDRGTPYTAQYVLAFLRVLQTLGRGGKRAFGAEAAKGCHGSAVRQNSLALHWHPPQQQEATVYQQSGESPPDLPEGPRRVERGCRRGPAQMTLQGCTLICVGRLRFLPCTFQEALCGNRSLWMPPHPVGPKGQVFANITLSLSTECFPGSGGLAFGSEAALGPPNSSCGQALGYHCVLSSLAASVSCSEASHSSWSKVAPREGAIFPLSLA